MSRRPRVTLETASTRATALSEVGFCEPNVPPAWAMMRFVPSWASWAWSWPLALSVRPMAQTMAATPMMGPSMIISVLVFRAVRPFNATPMRSRAGSLQRPGQELVGHDLAVSHGYPACPPCRRP